MGRGGLWCIWEGKGRACQESARGKVYLWTATVPKGPTGVPGSAARVCPLQLFHNNDLEPKAVNEAETGVKQPVLCLKHRVGPLSQKECKQEIMSHESKSSSLSSEVQVMCSSPLLHHLSVLLRGTLGWLKGHCKTCPALPLLSLLEQCSTLCPAFPSSSTSASSLFLSKHV